MDRKIDKSKWFMILVVAAIVALLLPGGGLPGQGSLPGGGSAQTDTDREGEQQGNGQQGNGQQGGDKAQADPDVGDGGTVGQDHLTAEDGSAVGQVGDLAETETVEYEIDGRIVLVKAGEPERNVLTAVGSGVVYAVSEEYLWIVTAGHVLENAGNYTVWVDFGGVADATGSATGVVCSAYELAESADLAFLQLPLNDISRGIRAQLLLPRTDKKRYDALRREDVVCVRGFVDDKCISCEGVLTDSWILVEDFDQYMMLADCKIEPGMSGGGLYDEEDNLIGIACGGNEKGELAAVPLHVVQARFEEINR